MTQPATVAGVVEGSPAAQAGIRAGDRIVSINGAKIAQWEDAVFELAIAAPGKPIALQMDRGRQLVSVSVDTAAQRGPRDEFAILGFPKERVVIGAVTSGSPAEKSGLKSGDEVAAANGKPILNSIELATMIRSSDGKPVQLSVVRDGQAFSLEVLPKFGDPGDGVSRWQIGIGFRAATVHQPHSLPNAAYRGVMYNVRLANQIFDILGGLFEGRVSLKQLEGPVGIVRESGQAARRGVMDFISLMGVISLNLGILNLLPIPILDGGHILMLGIEATIRRDLSLAVKERFVQAGLVFLLAIIAYVTYHDIFRILWSR
jgi:regulator of sigma E protease